MAKKKYRESYIYSDSFDMEWEQKYGSCEITYRDFSTLPKAGKGHDQRISVISNTSSNTTSGIVSDKVQSLDGSEDDLDLEIMLNSPPALSVESLPNTAISDSEWEPHSYYRSVSAMNFSCDDLPLEILQLKDEQKAKKLENCCVLPNFTARSQTNSSSSYQSISTVRSCSQLNVNSSLENKCNTSSLPYLSCSCTPAASDDFSVANCLPKTYSANHLDSSLGHCHHYHHHHHHHHYVCNSSSEANMMKPQISPFNLTDESEADMSDGTLSLAREKKRPCRKTSENHCIKTKSTASSHPTNSRILTSIGVQAPFLPPPNINFQLPQNRTKIGVSSLSRAAHLGKSCSAISNSSTVPKMLHDPDINSNFLKRLSVNLPPTPLFYSDDLPKYEPVLTNSLENLELLKTISATSPTYPIGKPKLEDFQFDGKIIHKDKLENEEELKLEELDFIPPPPLYANPEDSTHNDNSDEELCSQESNDRFHTLSSQLNSLNPHSQDSLLTDSGALLNCSDVMRTELHSADEKFQHSFIPPPPAPFLSKILDTAESKPNSDSSLTSKSAISQHKLDIDNLRKKSKDLDLPLISALCNDRSLVPLSRAQLTIPRRRMSCDQPNSITLSTLPNTRPLSWHLGSETANQIELMNPSFYSHTSMHSLPCHKLPLKERTSSLLTTKSSSSNSLTENHMYSSVTNNESYLKYNNSNA